MLLKFTKEPEFYANLNQDFLSEIYEMEFETKEGLFQLGESLIDFDKIILELQRTDYNTIRNIYITFPDVDAEKIKEISDYYGMDKEQTKKIEDLDKATLVFSVDKEAIGKYIQPNYDSPEKSLQVFNFVNEEENPVLLNFKYFNTEGFL